MKFLIYSILFTTILTADYFTRYVKYDEDHELGKITITKELLRGHYSVDTFYEKLKSFEKKGMYKTSGELDKSRKIIKTTSIQGHDIRTEIKIYYPRIRGLDGGIPIIKVNLWFDNKQFIKDIYMDCVGLSYGKGRQYIDKIEVHPEDQFITTYLRSCDYDKEYLYVFTDHDENKAIQFIDNNIVVK